MSFTDDFERALLGPNWADDGPIFEDEGYVRADQSLDDGAWVSAEDSTEGALVIAMGSIRYVAAAGENQFIEAEVGNFFQGHDASVAEYLQWVEGQVYLFAQISPGSNEGIGLVTYINVSGSFPDGIASQEIFTTDSAGARTFHNSSDSIEPLVDWQSNPDYIIRLEVSAAGHVRGYFDGDLIVEDDVTPPGGDHIGIGMEWNLTSYPVGNPPNPGESLRFNWVTGSLAAGFTGWRIGRIGWGSSPW